MIQSITVRVLLGLLGVVLIFSNLWRPWFGMHELTGPFIWAAGCAGVLIILAALYNGGAHEKIESVDPNA